MTAMFKKVSDWLAGKSSTTYMQEERELCDVGKDARNPQFHSILQNSKLRQGLNPGDPPRNIDLERKENVKFAVVGGYHGDDPKDAQDYVDELVEVLRTFESEGGGVSVLDLGTGLQHWGETWIVDIEMQVTWWGSPKGLCLSVPAPQEEVLVERLAARGLTLDTTLLDLGWHHSENDRSDRPMGFSLIVDGASKSRAATEIIQAFGRVFGLQQGGAILAELHLDPRDGYMSEQLDVAESTEPEREHIPSAVRREVWRRDQGRCVNCGSREKLEFDHIIPVAKGGSNTARNIELLCESCNRSKGAAIK